MSQWDVFRPSSGPLMVRHSMDQGIMTDLRPRTSGQPQWAASSLQQQQRLNSASNTWMFTRHNPHPARVRHFKGLNDQPICSVFDEGYETSSEPGTPQYDDLPLTSSHNGFSSSIFTRHNPHPNRVKHITGLWGAPICNVFDEGYPNNPRYALPFPPDNYNQAKLRYYGQYKPRPLPGSASINVNAPLLPIDTLTGLLKYTDKRHFHMTADVAKLPLGPPSWREEARAMIEALGLNPNPSQPLAGTPPAPSLVLPPVSRMSTPGTATGSRPATSASQAGGQLELTDEERAEIMMLQALCQLLKTRDVRSAQEWLVAAPEREKALVVDMLRTSLSLYAQLADNNTNDVTTASYPDDVTKPSSPLGREAKQPFLGLRRAATSGDLFNYQSEVKPAVKFANNRQQASPSSPPPRPSAINQAPPRSPSPKKAGSVSLRYTKAPVTQADIVAKVFAA